MKIKTTGIDIAKEFFQVDGVNEQGKVLVRKQIRRTRCSNSIRDLRHIL